MADNGLPLEDIGLRDVPTVGAGMVKVTVRMPVWMAAWIDSERANPRIDRGAQVRLKLARLYRLEHEEAK